MSTSSSLISSTFPVFLATGSENEVTRGSLKNVDEVILMMMARRGVVVLGDTVNPPEGL